MITYISCPICSEIGNIAITLHDLYSSKSGLISANIVKDVTCKHSYIAYIDRNGDVRGYLTVDFTIQLPNKTFDDYKHIKIPNKSQLDIYYLKINIVPCIFSCALKAIFRGENALIITNDEKLIKEGSIFFNYITDNIVENRIFLMNKEEYSNNKNVYKNYYILHSNTDKKYMYHNDDLHIENKIIQVFFKENNHNSSLLVLRNEILKAFKLSNKIIKIISVYDQKKIDIKTIVKHIEKSFDIKISSIYLHFLINIIENYFKFNFPKRIKTVSKLIF